MGGPNFKRLDRNSRTLCIIPLRAEPYYWWQHSTFHSSVLSLGTECSVNLVQALCLPYSVNLEYFLIFLGRELWVFTVQCAMCGRGEAQARQGHQVYHNIQQVSPYINIRRVSTHNFGTFFFSICSRLGYFYVLLSTLLHLPPLRSTFLEA